MKHIKTYKVFESFDGNIIPMNDINDIFMDLKDDGFKIQINPRRYGAASDYHDILISSFIIYHNDVFIYTEVKSCVDHLISHMNGLGFYLVELRMNRFADSEWVDVADDAQIDRVFLKFERKLEK